MKFIKLTPIANGEAVYVAIPALQSICQPRPGEPTRICIAGWDFVLEASETPEQILALIEEATR